MIIFYKFQIILETAVREKKRITLCICCYGDFRSDIVQVSIT